MRYGAKNLGSLMGKKHQTKLKRSCKVPRAMPIRFAHGKKKKHFPSKLTRASNGSLVKRFVFFLISFGQHESDPVPLNWEDLLFEVATFYLQKKTLAVGRLGR